ncbi:MAG TPA: hypothetical protein VNT31_07355 [Nocardioides sp.]|nr:hypothetical protein [Nocardioides sp.]
MDEPTRHDQSDLGHLLRDAVADVVPRDHLGEIRQRTRRPAARTRQRWAAAVLGAGVATAAVVGAVALAGKLGLPGVDSDPAGTPGRPDALAAYFVGDTPLGPRLFREFQAVPTSSSGEERALAALRLLEVDAGPDDPDYRTNWTDGSFAAVRVDDDRIRIEVSDSATAVLAGPDARQAAQQAVLTAQAALGDTRPVRLEAAAGPLAVDGLTELGRERRLLAPVSITDPVEGHSVDDRLTVRGTVGPVQVEQEALGAVDWELRADDGSVAESGSVPLDGLAWEETADIAAVPAGSYLLVAVVPTTAGPATDTRTVTVR